MAIKIVTDSTADLPKDLCETLGISTVPLNVQFGETSYLDGIDIQAEEFFSMLSASDKLPTTSQPSPGTFLDHYSKLVGAGHDIVSIHVSGKLSQTVNSAEIAKAKIEDSKSSIIVIDSQQCSAGLGLIAIAAAKAAQAGATLQETVAIAEKAISKIGIFITLDTLEYLQKGGRIGKAQALLGSLLQMKPILTLLDGAIHPLEKTRTRAKAIQRMYSIAEEQQPFISAAVIHSASEDAALELEQHLGSLIKALPQEEQGIVYTNSIGPVVGTHGGPGVVGFAIQRK